MEHLHMKTHTQQIEELNKEWTNPHWEGVTRLYSAEGVMKLRGLVNPECTLAQLNTAKIQHLLHGEAKKGYVNGLGAPTGGQTLQQVKAGIKAIYLSGWRVAAGANLTSNVYPDQSPCPASSVLAVADRINNTFHRADQIQRSVGIEPNDPHYIDYFLPIVTDTEVGFGGVLNAFELMKSMIEVGATAVRFEDQLASVKKCGRIGDKMLAPTQEAIQRLVAARLAADVMGIPTLVIARTDADVTDLITSDYNPCDREFITGDRTSEGFFRTHAEIKQAISCGLTYAPYANLMWCKTSKPDLKQARRFVEAIHARFPDKLLIYSYSPLFNWKKNLDGKTVTSFQQQLSGMGHKYQFITPAGIHSVWFSMFDLVRTYVQGEGIHHRVERVQQPEFVTAPEGYSFVSHQQEVGTGYLDRVTAIIRGGASSVTALTGSTEGDQF